MSIYSTRQPITDANYYAAFSSVFGGLPSSDPMSVETPTARVRVRVKPNDGHRRTATPEIMADWMRHNPESNTRDAMLVEFTETELRDHFTEAKRIYSRTLAAA